MHGRVRGVGTDLNLNRVRADAQIDGVAHVVQTVRCRDYVVLIRLQNISMNVALKCARHAHSLTIDEEAGVCAQRLQIQPVAAAGGNRERAVPGRCRVGLQGVATLDRKVQGRIDVSAFRPRALEPWFALVAECSGGNR